MKTALVLEGGAYRGQFTAGVLDVLLEHNIVDFQAIYGVSAGALNGCNFMSRQQGRSIRMALALRDDKRFMSMRSLIKTGSLVGNEFFYHEVQNKLDPLDYETFNKSTETTKFYAVATDVLFGTATYFPVHTMPADTDKICASASMPTVSEMVKIDGGKYLDGGTADSVPVERAIDDGYDKLVVVLTQDRSYIKNFSPHLQKAAETLYSKYPYLLAAMRNRHERYNEQRRHIWDLEQAGKALVIAPEKPVELSLVDNSGTDLLSLYVSGRQQTSQRFEEISQFLHA